ncbi:hypothetical protein BB558_006551 [Smittium angustum]|uniref:Protein kinase domain-containing protein n=1 Tax=Smittium angustum TaxID=133377 RepID=A0A2U1IXN4_SMIAN|nr:hypothetical protein BB558_006551 [Smittium angustum]
MYLNPNTKNQNPSPNTNVPKENPKNFLPFPQNQSLTKTNYQDTFVWSKKEIIDLLVKNGFPKFAKEFDKLNIKGSDFYQINYQTLKSLKIENVKEQEYKQLSNLISLLRKNNKEKLLEKKKSLKKNKINVPKKPITERKTFRSIRRRSISGLDIKPHPPRSDSHKNDIKPETDPIHIKNTKLDQYNKNTTTNFSNKHQIIPDSHLNSKNSKSTTNIPNKINDLYYLHQHEFQKEQKIVLDTTDHNIPLNQNVGLNELHDFYKSNLPNGPRKFNTEPQPLKELDYKIYEKQLTDPDINQLSTKESPYLDMLYKPPFSREHDSSTLSSSTQAYKKNLGHLQPASDSPNPPHKQFLPPTPKSNYPNVKPSKRLTIKGLSTFTLSKVLPDTSPSNIPDPITADHTQEDAPNTTTRLKKNAILGIKSSHSSSENTVPDKENGTEEKIEISLNSRNRLSRLSLLSTIDQSTIQNEAYRNLINFNFTLDSAKSSYKKTTEKYKTHSPDPNDLSTPLFESNSNSRLSSKASKFSLSGNRKNTNNILFSAENEVPNSKKKTFSSLKVFDAPPLNFQSPVLESAPSNEFLKDSINKAQAYTQLDEIIDDSLFHMLPPKKIDNSLETKPSYQYKSNLSLEIPNSTNTPPLNNQSLESRLVYDHLIQNSLNNNNISKILPKEKVHNYPKNYKTLHALGIKMTGDVSSHSDNADFHNSSHQTYMPIEIDKHLGYSQHTQITSTGIISKPPNSLNPKKEKTENNSDINNLKCLNRKKSLNPNLKASGLRISKSVGSFEDFRQSQEYLAYLPPLPNLYKQQTLVGMNSPTSHNQSAFKSNTTANFEAVTSKITKDNPEFCISNSVSKSVCNTPIEGPRISSKPIRNQSKNSHPGLYVQNDNTFPALGLKLHGPYGIPLSQENQAENGNILQDENLPQKPISDYPFYKQDKSALHSSSPVSSHLQGTNILNGIPIPEFQFVYACIDFSVSSFKLISINGLLSGKEVEHKIITTLLGTTTVSKQKPKLCLISPSGTPESYDLSSIDIWKKCLIASKSSPARFALYFENSNEHKKHVQDNQKNFSIISSGSATRRSKSNQDTNFSSRELYASLLNPSPENFQNPVFSNITNKSTRTRHNNTKVIHKKPEQGCEINSSSSDSSLPLSTQIAKSFSMNKLNYKTYNTNVFSLDKPGFKNSSPVVSDIQGNVYNIQNPSNNIQQQPSNKENNKDYYSPLKAPLKDNSRINNFYRNTNNNNQVKESNSKENMIKSQSAKNLFNKINAFSPIKGERMNVFKQLNQTQNDDYISSPERTPKLPPKEGIKFTEGIRKTGSKYEANKQESFNVGSNSYFGSHVGKQTRTHRSKTTSQIQENLNFKKESTIYTGLHKNPNLVEELSLEYSNYYRRRPSGLAGDLSLSEQESDLELSSNMNKYQNHNKTSKGGTVSINNNHLVSSSNLKNKVYLDEHNNGSNEEFDSDENQVIEYNQNDTTIARNDIESPKTNLENQRFRRNALFDNDPKSPSVVRKSLKVLNSHEVPKVYITDQNTSRKPAEILENLDLYPGTRANLERTPSKNTYGRPNTALIAADLDLFFPDHDFDQPVLETIKVPIDIPTSKILSDGFNTDESTDDKDTDSGESYSTSVVKKRRSRETKNRFIREAFRRSINTALKSFYLSENQNEIPNSEKKSIFIDSEDSKPSTSTYSKNENIKSLYLKNNEIDSNLLLQLVGSEQTDSNLSIYQVDQDYHDDMQQGGDQDENTGTFGSNINVNTNSLFQFDSENQASIKIININTNNDEHYSSDENEPSHDKHDLSKPKRSNSTSKHVGVAVSRSRSLRMVVQENVRRRNALAQAAIGPEQGSDSLSKSLRRDTSQSTQERDDLNQRRPFTTINQIYESSENSQKQLEPYSDNNDLYDPSNIPTARFADNGNTEKINLRANRRTLKLKPRASTKIWGLISQELPPTRKSSELRRTKREENRNKQYKNNDISHNFGEYKDNVQTEKIVVSSKSNSNDDECEARSNLRKYHQNSPNSIGIYSSESNNDLMQTPITPLFSDEFIIKRAISLMNKKEPQTKDQQELVDAAFMAKKLNAIENKKSLSITNINSAQSNKYQMKYKKKALDDNDLSNSENLATAVVENASESVKALFDMYGLPAAPVKMQWLKGRLIGKGSFGQVYLGLNVSACEVIAVKQIKIPTLRSFAREGQKEKRNLQLDQLYSEIKLLKDLDHPNIVQYLGFEAKDNLINIFLEYVSGGTISSLIVQHGSLAEPVIYSFLNQILSSLDYLHKNKILHRDIKSANILVEETGICKLSDFGISKKNDYSKAYDANSRMSVQGSIFWIAPEVIKGSKYSAKVDIWSLGCVLIEMWSGRRPWYGMDTVQAMFKLGDGIGPPLPDDLTSDGLEFCSRCFASNPNERSTAAELLLMKVAQPLPNYDYKNFYGS